jgi:hypothetical protein
MVPRWLVGRNLRLGGPSPSLRLGMTRKNQRVRGAGVGEAWRDFVGFFVAADGGGL